MDRPWSGLYGPVLWLIFFNLAALSWKEYSERTFSIGLPLWRYDHPGFWLRGWSQELNVPSAGQVAEAFVQFVESGGKGHSKLSIETGAERS